MKRDYFVVIGGIIILAFAFMMDMTERGIQPGAYQCVTCANHAKTGSSISEDYDEIYVDGIITDIQVKAGQGCYFPDGTCYEIVGGGIGYDYVQIQRVGEPGPECQAISHIEVCFDAASPTETEVPTSTSTPDLPTSTPTDTEEPTDTPKPSPTATSTVSPEPSESEEPTNTPDPTETFTPWPSRTPGPTPTSNGNGRG